MVYPDDFEQRLGFSLIRKELALKCTTDGAASVASSLSFSSDFSFISGEISITEEMRQAMVFDPDFHLEERADCRAVAKIGFDGQYLTIAECIALSVSSNCILSLQRFLSENKRYPRLKEVADSVCIPGDTISSINRIIDPVTCEIRDNASPRLSEIRRSMASKRKNISTRLQQVLSSAKSSGYTDENAEITFRDGHALIPVNASSKRKIQGFLMGESATGKTSYIEPIEVVELSNAISELESEEREEIIAILTRFTESLIPFRDDFRKLAEIIDRIDFIAAKASLAVSMGANDVIVEKNPTVILREARNPLLEKALKSVGKEIVPLSLQLDHEKRILLVSGPNAGGKSVCLKTVGLLQYMLQCGLLIPALQNSQMGVFDKIMLDIGDQQSIDNDLSTYSSHLRNMKTFLKNADCKSLFLIDEFGSGTEPTAGGAIAEAVLEKLIDSGAFGVITTHYANLKHFAMGHEGVENGAMTFDQGRIAPLFRLVQGEPGSSFAFEIAHNIGLPQEVIASAREKMAPEHIVLEKLLKEAARDKRYWEKKREKARIEGKKLDEMESSLKEKEESIRERRNEIIGNARREAARIIEDAGSLVERTIREIKEAEADKERTKKAREELDTTRRELRSKEPKPKKSKVEFKVGDIVELEGSEIPGEIIQLSGNKAMVRFGAIISQTQKSLLKPSSKQLLKPIKAGRTLDTLTRRVEFRDRIDVRGMRTQEALEKVTRLIDDAMLLGIPEIKILHGKGEGILKEQIRSYIMAEGIASSIQDENEDMGGAGITVIKF